LTGLTGYIDARLADAHELVQELEGLFDFVLSDANKEWYKNDFVVLAPKLEVGGFLLHIMSLGGLIETSKSYSIMC
jgi:predicted O-methyltransferase YrrM